MQSIVTQCFEKHGQHIWIWSHQAKKSWCLKLRKKLTVKFSLSGNFFLPCGNLAQPASTLQRFIHTFHKTLRMWIFHIIHVVAKCKARETKSSVFAGPLTDCMTLTKSLHLSNPQCILWKCHRNSTYPIQVAVKIKWDDMCKMLGTVPRTINTQYILTMIIIICFIWYFSYKPHSQNPHQISQIV